jgi:hypothetical protein
MGRSHAQWRCLDSSRHHRRACRVCFDIERQSFGLLQSHESSAVHAAQLAPRQPTPGNVLHCLIEPASVVRLALGEAEDFLIGVALKVERGAVRALPHNRVILTGFEAGSEVLGQV